MRRTRDVTVGEAIVTVKELTVAEIRAWLKDLEAEGDAQVDVLGVALFEQVSLEDMRRMTNMAPAHIEQMTPSELRLVIEAAQELNQDFFALRARMVQVSRAILPGA